MTLKIYLLGQFKLEHNDLSLELPSRPAQSLLAYLALNPGIAHRREKLAGLLWPDSSEGNARGYLRQALWRIRKSLESGSLTWEDYLEINKISVTFIKTSDYWLDAADLLLRDESLSLGELAEVVRNYQGELLPGFYEEWIGVERSSLQSAYHQKMNLLVDGLVQVGDWNQALEWSEHWVRHGHSPEPAFRAMMVAYAGLGDQAMVSATYERCGEALDRELGLEASPETEHLYHQLLHQESPLVRNPPAPVSELAIQRPSFLDEFEFGQIEKPTFVAREPELAQLEGHLHSTLSNRGRVIFITGEAGSGKTALLGEFTRRALDEHPDLIVASGNCNAHTGVGDPYLPFREILGMLTGEVEARLEAGAITRDHASRLWNALPLTLRTLVQSGPTLIDTFVPGAALIQRASACVPEEREWLTRLAAVVERQGSKLPVPGPQRSDLFEQYTRVVRSLARAVPLVLLLDDLQWADAGSVGLLFHLGRQLVGSPILVVGAYRQEEVAMGRDSERHPLEPVVNEFQREFGAISVNLSHADRWKFVEALLDSEPNQLGAPFREMLHRQTQGHPLFTIELLRGMQERGDLIRDQDGRWVEGPKLDWESIPARVEAVIAERIGRLPQPSQSALRVASVEGEVFTAEVIARVLHIDDRELLIRLSGELDRKHRLVRADSIKRSDGQLLSSYRFRHILFQKYLYSSLDEVERVHLHEQIGTVLEELFTAQEGIPAVALQLARHFEEAGILEKAIYYMHQAGERAIHLSAYQEGIAHLTRGMELLQLLPDSPERDQLELTLQLSLVMSWKYNWASPQGRSAFDRARELCRLLGKTAPLSRVMGELSTYHYVRAEYTRALEYASEAFSLAQQAEDPILVAEGHWYLGIVNFCLGKYTAANGHLEQVIDFYNPEQHHRSLIFLRGADGGLSAMAYSACCLWCLGYPDRASKRSHEALSLARKFAHPFTLADVLCYAGCMFNAMRRDAHALMESAEALARLSERVSLSLSGWLGMGIGFRGEAMTMLGQIEGGTAKMREGIEINQATGVHLYRPVALQSLAKAQAEAGQLEAGLATLTEAMSVMEQSGDRNWEAEIHRLRAEILVAQGDDRGAESSFRKAIEVSRHQQAKSWELRASIGLARLWGQKQDKVSRARGMLAEIYGWFTEGFDTPDLTEAKVLLDELS